MATCTTGRQRNHEFARMWYAQTEGMTALIDSHEIHRKGRLALEVNASVRAQPKEFRFSPEEEPSVTRLVQRQEKNTQSSMS